MPVEIYLTKENLISQKLIQLIKEKSEKALKLLKIPKKEVSITLTNNSYIQKLNKEYLNRDYPTNILSFPFTKEGISVSNILGEIIISVEKAQQEAQAY